MPAIAEKPGSEFRGVFALKGVNKTKRQIEGYFTTVDEDREGETFESSWFAPAIREGGNYYNNPVVLFNHNNDRTIGTALVDSFEIDEVGVYCVCKINDDEIWQKIIDGELNCFSWFGYVYFDEGYVDLVEISVVSTPCNPKALFKIKKKAISIGKGTEDDFPMPKEPKWKSIHLGPYAESEAAMSAISSLGYRMQYKISYLMEDIQSPKKDRVKEIGAVLAEYGEIAVKLIDAILPDGEQGVAVAKSLRELIPANILAELEGDTSTEGDDMALTAEEIAAITTGIGAAVGEAVKKGLEPLEAKIAALATPAAVVPPAAVPAAAPVGSTTPPESPGDRAAVASSKGVDLSEETIIKIGAGLAAGLIAAGAVPATKGLVADKTTETDATKLEEQKQARVKNLVTNIAKTGYSGSNVEQRMREHLHDAIAIEFTNGEHGYDDLPEG